MKKILLLVVQCCICGLGIGWLIGLSTTPLLQGILTSIMTIVVAMLTAISGISADNTANDLLTRLKSINLSGLASFVLCFAIAASVGLYVRTNEFLGLNPDKFASKWKSNSYTENDIKRKMFDKIYSKDSLSEQKQKELGNSLYAISTSQCAELAKIETYKELLAELRTFEEIDPRIKKFLETSSDSASIFALKKIICP